MICAGYNYSKTGEKCSSVQAFLWYLGFKRTGKVKCRTLADLTERLPIGRWKS